MILNFNFNKVKKKKLNKQSQLLITKLIMILLKIIQIVANLILENFKIKKKFLSNHQI